MKKTSSVSSLPIRLSAIALTPTVQSAAASRPVQRSNRAAASRKSGIAVNAPNNALGKRRAASSLAAGCLPRIGCAYRAPHKELHQHRVFGICGKIVSLIRVYRVEFVHFVFRKSDGSKLICPQTKAHYQQQSERPDDTPLHPRQPNKAAGHLHRTYSRAIGGDLHTRCGSAKINVLIQL